MSKFKTLLSLLNTPGKMILPLANMGFLNWMSDSLFAKLSFRGMMNEKLHLNNPNTFNEKLQWLKVYDHRPEYTDLVDKLKAKDIVGQKIGYNHIVPVYGEWNDAEEIPFSDLPEKYVLKCNHDQGSVIVVDNKNTINTKETIDFFKKKLNRSIYPGTREYPYKSIKPKVFAEKNLGDRIIDYKFYCFNGEPKFLYCGQGLTIDHSLKIDFYDLDWNLMPFYRTDYKRLGVIPKPDCLEEMIDISRSLSVGVPFVRIDLFYVNHTVYFSEFTLCPASGFMPFVPKEYDRIVGEWLQLPEKGKK